VPDPSANAEEQFSITYDGTALQAGRISVRQLAPSLLAMAEMIPVASKLRAPEGQEPGLEIKANRPGSFIVDLVVTDLSSTLRFAESIFTSRPVIAGDNFIGIAVVVVSAVNLIRSRWRGTETSTEQIKPGWAKIVLDDGTFMNVPKESIMLSNDVIFRRAAHDFVQPLESPGVSEIRLEHPAIETIRISSEDLSGFEVGLQEGEVLLHVENTRISLRAVSVAFSEGNKWRVNDGQLTFWVTVEDESFMKSIQMGNEAFRATDTFNCDLQIRQFRTASGGLRSERAITKIHAHTPGHYQEGINF
jgi:hypothetical protein